MVPHRAKGDGASEASVPVVDETTGVSHDVRFDGSVAHVHGQPMIETEEGFVMVIGGVNIPWHLMEKVLL